MKLIYELRGGNGTQLFETRAAAEQAARAIPKEWGRDVGGRNVSVGEVRVFSTVAEWSEWTGFKERP